MVEGFVGSERFIVSCFATAMIVVSSLGVLDLYLSPADISNSLFGKIVLGGWVVSGAVGVVMGVLLLTGNNVSVFAAFVGLLFGLSWISVEMALFKKHGDGNQTPIGKLVSTHVPQFGN